MIKSTLSSLFCVLSLILGAQNDGLVMTYRHSVVIDINKGVATPLMLLEDTDKWIAGNTGPKGESDCNSHWVRTFTDSKATVDSFIERRCFTKGEDFSIYRRDSLVHRFWPGLADQKGTLNGKTDEIKFKKNTGANQSHLERYYLKSDTSNFIIYDPKKNFISEESTAKRRQVRLKGFTFIEIQKPGAFTKQPMYSINNLRLKDTLQVLMSSKKDTLTGKFENAPAHLSEFTLIKDTIIEEIPHKIFSWDFTDLKSGTTESRDPIDMIIYPDVISMNGVLAIPDTGLKRGLRISDPLSTDWTYYLFPANLPTEKIIEGLYSKKVAAGSDSLTYTTYWNNVLASAVTWAVEFPLPWQDQEYYRGEVVYMNKGGKRYGTPYRIARPETFHIQRVEQLPALIKIKLFSPVPTKIKIEVVDGKGAPALSALPELTLDSGTAPYDLNIAGLSPGNIYTIIISEASGSGKRLSEYHFIPKAQ